MGRFRSVQGKERALYGPECCSAKAWPALTGGAGTRYHGDRNDPATAATTFSICDASAPLFMRTLTNMQAWLDKAIAKGPDETALMSARWS